MIRRPPIEDFLVTYNDLLAARVAAHPDDPRYVASATLNRLEAQTHFFDRLEKYVQTGERPRPPGPLAWIHFGLSWCLRLGSTLALALLSRLFVRFDRKRDVVLRTWFDHRCVGESALREEYFGPFVDDLAARRRLLVVYRLLDPRDVLFFLRNRRKAAPFSFCLLESFLSPAAIVRAYVGYLGSRLRLESPCVYKGVDVAGLLQDSADEDFFRCRGLGVYLEIEAAAAILATAPERLYYPYENQTWEKVYPLVRRRLGVRTRIVGFQHTGLSYKLLNYFPSERERGLPHFPDKIVTVGATLKRVLEEKAHFPCPIVEGAALRHAKWLRGGAFDVAPADETVRGAVVYAFSYDLSKYRGILEALLEAFGAGGVDVYLKIHPDYKERRVLRSLGLRLPPNFIPAQSIPWSRLYGMVDCVLYDDNSIGLEGMMHGLKTFLLDVAEPVYACDRMFGFSLWGHVLDRDGLARLARALKEKTFEKRVDREAIRAYVGGYYNPYSAEKYYDAFR